MILPATTIQDKRAAVEFLRGRGVEIPYSDDLQAIGRFDKAGKPLGIVAYNGFNGKVCCIHMAGKPGWISRDFLKVAFYYPFEQLKLIAVVGVVAGDNVEVIRLDKHLGFSEAFRIPDGMGVGVDIVGMTMYKEDCKWLKESYHERKTARVNSAGLRPASAS